VSVPKIGRDLKLKPKKRKKTKRSRHRPGPTVTGRDVFPGTDVRRGAVLQLELRTMRHRSPKTMYYSKRTLIRVIIQRQVTTVHPNPRIFRFALCIIIRTNFEGELPFPIGYYFFIVLSIILVGRPVTVSNLYVKCRVSLSSAFLS